MVAELKKLHEDLLSALGELEEITAEPRPDGVRLSAVRWKLSKASGRRLRHLEEFIYPLIGEVDAAVGQRLRQLRDEAPKLRGKSTSHVARWTVAAVLEDWAGYCEASREMRQSMRRRIAEERQAVELLESFLKAHPLSSRAGPKSSAA